MSARVKRGPAWLAALWLASAGQAWAAASDIGTAGATILLAPASARWLALGNGGTSAGDGADAWAVNPAAPARSAWFNTEWTLRRQFEDTEQGYLSFTLPLSDSALSLGVITSKTSGIMAFDGYAEQGEFSTQTLILKAGYALLLGDFAAGASLLMLSEDLYTEKIVGAGIDLGGLWRLSPDLSLGLSMLHAGVMTALVPFPSEWRLGADYRIRPDLRVLLDVVFPWDENTYAAGGLEWLPWPFLALRAGWHTGPASNYLLGGLSGLTAGAGLSFGSFSLDYAFEPQGLLGSSHQVSLGYHYLPPRPEKSAPQTAPAPAAATAATIQPRLTILPREYAGRVVYAPKTPSGDMKVRQAVFSIRSPDGLIVRSYTFAGNAVPKELVWDGRDARGQLVNPDQNYTFEMAYVTSAGTTATTRIWPRPLIVRKLYFEKGGAGVAPQAVFAFSGARDEVSSWQVQVLERSSRVLVKTLSGRALPPSLTWDGRDEAGAWAPSNRRYDYQLCFTGKDGSQIRLEHPVVPIQAEIMARQERTVTVKIVQVLFDFASFALRAEMADRIDHAVQLQREGAVLRQIWGHADDVGTREANEAISRKRALAVKEYLERSGATGEISITGFGKQQPVRKGSSEAARAQNRRVEIILDVPAAPRENTGK